ncbi:MAG: nucleotide exchange factor GrpE [Clostridia bacterium]|nr:nucleotide exchange factor GrpE [Clostridia bacterium]
MKENKKEKDFEKSSSKEQENTQEKEQNEETFSKDDFLRLAAEYDNYRKRTQKEKNEIYIVAKCDLVSKLLPFVDNFEVALENKTNVNEDYHTGMQMILNQFNQILKNEGIEAFGQKGDTFDPNIHEAIMHIEDENFDENSVIEVFRTGYRYKERIIRPATVKVAN